MTAGIAERGDQACLPAAIAVGGDRLPVWPDGQSIAPLAGPLMAITTFADHRQFHESLAAAVQTAEKDPRFGMEIFRGGCSVKVRRIERWRHTAADLVHARAITFAHRTLSRKPVFVDDSWASVYRAGDYCMPHSHLRSNVSLVYMLDVGDADPEDRLAGRLCFADPRIPACCPDEPGRVTRLVMPDMTPGTMVIFASDYLHHVNPYPGTRPRITMSWNVALERLPGEPGEGWS